MGSDLKRFSPVPEASNALRLRHIRPWHSRGLIRNMAENQPATPEPSPGDAAGLPPLPVKNRSFLCFLGTQALGAFNDNVFKQLVLLLGVGFLMAGVEYQAVVQFLFALPFLLFSGLAGDIADRISKGRMMVLCKVAEVLIALLGVGAFLVVSSMQPATGNAPLSLWLLAGVTFLLGTQSAFFGPPKYGGLPELVRPADLTTATGLTQMTTFLAIIFGVALAGLLADLLVGRYYLAGLITVSIAVLGALVSVGIARNPPADPQRRITTRSFISILHTLAEIFRQDGLMLRVMFIYSWFWFVGGVALTAINALGRLQLGMNNFETSLMVSTTSLGIAIGSVLVSRLSHGKVRLGLVIPALLLLVVCLLAFCFLPVHNPTLDDLQRFNEIKSTPELLETTRIIPPATYGIRVTAFCLFFLLGVASGFYSVPLLTFIQSRPPLSEKGKVFAAVNWFNWIFILAAALAYGVGMAVLGNRANLLLALLGGVTLLLGIALLPGIFQLMHRERPEFVYFRKEQAGA
jgi:acyl-[acyl-carrier-protein]-phospholipid O-acyltransferase/long-chain-fatty-acid--[acyl-carrier-protein] ligase